MYATVIGIEYDPNRSANIALIEYEDGERAYILAPIGLTDGDKVIQNTTVNYTDSADGSTKQQQFDTTSFQRECFRKCFAALC